jgi:hypothetical protein
LRDIAKELVKFQKNQIRFIKKNLWGVNLTDDSEALKTYGSTVTQPNSETLKGMNYTIELAMLLESIAAMPIPEQQEPEEDDTDDAEGDDDDTDADESGTVESGGQGGGDSGANKLGEQDDPEQLKEKKDKSFDRQDVQRKAKDVLKQNIGTRGIGEWLPLCLKRMPMSITVPGAIGRKRVASNMGRNPRRMHRLLTDPDKRIFDKYVKAIGGVVLIDCSGSMRLSKEDVRDIMLAAPGCTVIGYSGSYSKHRDNTFILGEKGKICNELPRFWGGNGNDLPAIQYAVSLRQNSKTPVIWVTDGMVYRPAGGGEYDQRECAAYAQKNRVHMEHSPQQAVNFLNGLKKGNAYKPQILQRWKEHLKQVA